MTAPPGDLAQALSRPESQKQQWVDWLFSHIAERYDLGNDIMSLGWHARWKRRLVDYARIEPGMRVLDVATGTGDVAFLAGALTQAEVVGTDINADMMRVAEKKRPKGMDHVRFVQADATKLPLPDGHFDRVLIGYAGRGFPDLPGVMREAYRVLKPGGEVWNLDFARPRWKVVDVGYRSWMTASGAALGVALHGQAVAYTYIPASMASYRGQRWLDEEMRKLGFETELIHTMLELMAYNRGKKPA